MITRGNYVHKPIVKFAGAFFFWGGGAFFKIHKAFRIR